MNLGAHMSIAGGVHLALERGRSIGCNAIQLFVKSPSQWRAAKLDEEEVECFREDLRLFTPGFVLTHTSYLINLASPDRAILARSRKGFLEEVRRSILLGIPAIVLHPGSHRGAGEERGIATIAESLNLIIDQTADSQLTILLETTAGQGDTIGHRFEQLARIIDFVKEPKRIGICYDTCHSFAAGYDIRTKRAYRKTFEAFDSILGLERLMAFHLNDCLKGLGSRVDRHTHIGAGELGLPAFRLLMRDERFFDRPMILETPKGPDMKEDIKNLSILRSLRTTKKSVPPDLPR
ncbi:MAG: deoxyribonuclease IV [bacterium]|nr:MAG: deoxyribonuclease IV [bacterium]